MIHHHKRSMYFMFRKCFIFENYIRVKNGNIQCKSLDTFSSEVQSGKGAKRWRLCSLNRPSACDFSGIEIKIVLRISNSGLLCHCILKPEIGHQSSQLTHQSNSDLPKNRRKLKFRVKEH